MSEINWDKLQHEAEKAYEDEARRRRKAGEQATAEAEELAAALVRAGKVGAHGPDAAADQTVYAYRGPIMLGHFPPSTRWVAQETPEGMACQVLLFSLTEERYVFGPLYKPGEWTYCGRGLPGVAS